MAIGDTIYLTLLRSVAGLGEKGAVVGPILETTYTQGLVAAKYATSGSVAPPSPTPATNAPQDGQVRTWSAALGQDIYTNPVGGGELAYGANVSGVAIAASAASNLGTAVDITGAVISVGPSAGRPVTLTFGATALQSVIGDGDAYLNVVETTGGGALAVCSDIKRLPNTTNPPAYIAQFYGAFRLGTVASVRTFKLQLQLYATSGSSPSLSLLNSAGNPSWLRAGAA